MAVHHKMFCKSRFCADVKPIMKPQNSVALTLEKPRYFSCSPAVWMCEMHQAIIWNTQMLM